MTSPISAKQSLVNEYRALYQQGDEIDRFVARILNAEGNEKELETLRKELAPQHVLIPIGEYLKDNNPDVFETLFGKDAVFVLPPKVPEESKKGEDEVKKTDEVPPYTFDPDFVRWVRTALDALKNDPQFKDRSFKSVETAVARIWGERHKTADAAIDVLQRVYERLGETLGFEEAKSTRIFALIRLKMSRMTEDAMGVDLEAVVEEPSSDAHPSHRLRWRCLAGTIAGIASATLGLACLCFMKLR